MTVEHCTAVQDVLDTLKFNDWAFHARASADRVYIHVSWIDNCNFNRASEPFVQMSRRWLIRPEASRSEIVQTAFKCVLTALEHETREQFLYNGRAVFGPHYDVDALWELSEHMEVMK